MLRSSFLALALALVPASVLGVSFTASNDWDLACTSGTCRHFGGDGQKKAYSSFKISGPSGALSDITSAAGWKIEGCPADWESGAVHVKITCQGTRAQMAHCSQLFDDGGAVDTIVRLPAACGKAPFARVVSSEEITQTSKFIRGPETHSVVLDFDFAGIKKQRGTVDFEVTTSNIPTAVGAPTRPGAPAVMRRDDDDSPLMKRWDKTKMFDLPPLAVHENFNLFSTSISCPATGLGAGFDASVSVDAAVNVDAKVAFGFSVSGSIIPPKIKKLQVLGSLNGSAAADLTVNAHASGTFDIGQVPIYTAPLPNLNIPGIITVGPTFGVYGKLRGDVGIEAVVKTGISWSFPDVDVAFPQDSGSNGAQASSVKTPLVVSLDPKATASGLITAAIIPRLDVGINILSGLAQASVYVDLEAKAVLDLSVEGHAHVGTSLNIPFPLLPVKTRTGINALPSAPAFSFPLSLGSKTRTGFNALQTGVPKLDADAGASGCASLDAGLDITLGMKGTLKPLFDEEKTWDIFNTNVEVFNKCFDTKSKSKSKRDRVHHRRVSDTAIVKRDFTCPALGLGNLLELINL